ncbi:uncharacterized protein LACBIDRAFT_325123 [Laccaria bicolor S238N-H82]|uniref:Predicted protein n=1 Tax=Laccaria bicolor (strain S238N-H82 / ATCC MYA-4686) TaxID=486041 RepID=B0D584_LACBS|nr:uncharacterized protein LACBIDRAFT_325123 [Laccaria bicolor S238N-H82]EDR10235.1 predicted protein [Laccaria bicolor S238N-H82]|eukprot:XP_001878685.1 predicted protein [Laccaria bicolor S238N-H82]
MSSVPLRLQTPRSSYRRSLDGVGSRTLRKKIGWRRLAQIERLSNICNLFGLKAINADRIYILEIVASERKDSEGPEKPENCATFLLGKFCCRKLGDLGMKLFDRWRSKLGDSDADDPGHFGRLGRLNMKFTLIFSTAFLASISFVNGAPVKAAAPAAIEFGKDVKIDTDFKVEGPVSARALKLGKDVKVDTDLKVERAVFARELLTVSFFVHRKRMVELLRFALKPVKDVKLGDKYASAVWARGIKPLKEVDPDTEYADGTGLGGAVWVRNLKTWTYSVDL